MTSQDKIHERFENLYEILFFEDNSSDISLVQSNIESAGLTARFTVVKDLGKGMALLSEQHFDVALLNLNLPDSQGVESLERLRQAAPQLPVVVLSSMLDPDLALQLLRKGAQDCLLKSPALGVMIPNAVRLAVERQRNAAELDAQARRLAVSEARIRTFIDGNTDAIFVVDRTGSVRFVNQSGESMFGSAAPQLYSRPFPFLLVDGGVSEVDVTRESGETILAEMRVDPTDWDGEPAHLASLRDITHRKRLERAWAQSEKMQALGTLAAGMAHDFNNILLTVSGNAKLALEDLAVDHPARASVLEIAKAGSRAAALTRKILSFSRPEEPNHQTIEVQPTIEEALSLLRATLPARIEIRSHFSPGLPRIDAQASQLHQIIINLATNAADAFGDQPGVLEVSVSTLPLAIDGFTFSSNLAPGPYLRITVKDNGPGMSKATLARVFEPFFTTKAQGRGTGMGLAIVHGIMKNHRGEATVYSELGKGTVFKLYFPVRDTPASAQALAPSKALGGGQRILYVDDEEPLVLLITRTLKRLGYQVVGFNDPVEALKAYRQHPQGFDALVTDLSMPSMSGIELAREFKQIRSDFPIVVTSGYIFPQDQEAAKHLGVRELILKPDTVEELGDALHRLLGQPNLSAGTATSASN